MVPSARRDAVSASPFGPLRRPVVVVVMGVVFVLRGVELVDQPWSTREEEEAYASRVSSDDNPHDLLTLAFISLSLLLPPPLLLLVKL